MKLNTLLKFVVVVALLTAATSCTPIKKGEYAKGSATIFCDDGFRNILDEEIQVFEFSYPDASIIPFYVSEQEAIDTFLADKTQSIIITRELTQDEVKYMKSKFKRIVKQNCIAVDAVALITNKNNPVQQFSLQDVSDIMTGKISHWNQLAGADSTAIKLVFDNAGSSTVSYMRERFLPKGAKMSDNKNAFAQNNNAQVIDVVKKDPNAIGIISVSWLGNNLEKAKQVPVDQRVEDYNAQNDTIASELTTEVNIIKVSNPTEQNDFSPAGYKPYQAYIYSGEYPLYRKVYMISSASNSTVLNSFYTFLTGFVGQKIITKTGILPYHFPQRVVNLQ